ncbi:5-formyltetrahydrofolate cyclo-ligase [Saccharopolyspora sp. HNM0983]|uniref:5-formyltetrahydrofolate cyclo-ligase n=1 Tax=Saccharopolyspora montiporae TaxID=2781240 RepID=A0A929B8S6_9PSEU|nr:5-formyltetrahydrofolate cyclo-ligase [Saccharopolyspora sp. HNM0983]
MSTSEPIRTTKDGWRRELLGQRRALSTTTLSTEAAALLRGVRDLVEQRGTGTVAAYVPVGPEPGSAQLPQVLHEAGCAVLLPVVDGRQPLDWARYTGPESLREARMGLLEPAGERLGQHAIGTADLVLVPALGVDRRGVRLGRGAGYYDRSLPSAAAGVELVAVVRDAEFVEELPGEEHDVRMTAVLTPQAGFAPLPAAAR